MSLSVLCIVVASFYVVLWFFDSFFKSCMHYPYLAFLNGTGLQVGIFSFSWTTTAFNRSLYKWSKNCTRVLRRWFSVGYMITIFLFLPFALWTLLSFVFDHFYDSIQLSSGTEVQAMLPGVNIPVSDFWLYFLAIGISSILHELGHALAATQEDVNLIAIGVYVWTIIPVAYVQLNTEHINNISVYKRLKIYCAGVWHNIVIALIALVLYFLSPILFSLLYTTDVGVRVVDFKPDSPLNKVRGLEQDDVITSINGCHSKNILEWNTCLHAAHERYGICTSPDFIAENDESYRDIMKDDGVVVCCSKEAIYSFCFEFLEGSDNVLESDRQYTCLKPRDMVINGFTKCTEAKKYSCPKDMHCVRPNLNNITYLLIIERTDNNPVLYLGTPYDLHDTLIVDQYFPKLNIFKIFSPTKFERFLRYIFIFSLGIGFLNVIPCYGTDGHHIARSLIQILAKYLNKDGEFVTFFTLFSVVIGTGITIPMLIYLFYKAVVLGA